ncbi:unnamed protein product [Prorocentrum cordatum]|uniref:GAIN-B domain-containing protein n=1 Tax=Prorocentrum cordatum TaxID=2364126 RepID=A0ABN9SYA2_9DINO|nr:unnamed protein product [Polarella glacialis]
MSLVKAASTTEYTLLDDYVRLSTNIMLCDGAAVGGNIQVSWSWRQKLAVGAALWNAWTNDAGVAYTSLKMPVSQFGGAAEYEVKASIAGSGAGDAIFEVTVGDIPPPDAILSLPAVASEDCDFSIDASGSTDPGGADLSVAWACESDNASESAASYAAAAACSAKVTNETAFLITLPGGALDAGGYLFTVTVSRAGAQSTTSGAVLVTGTSQPVVSFAKLAAEVSPQQPLTVAATVSESAGCVSPAWKAWWLVAPDGSSATQLAASAATSLTGLSVPSLSAAPGAYYRMRLVLSEAAHAGFTEDISKGVYVFDSTVFLIDEPPTGGSCEVFPNKGNATLTRFTLSSLNWLDDDLPLLHKFSRCLGTVGDGCDSWTAVSAYSRSETLQNVLLSTPGTVMIKADAKDTLGSSSAAVTEVEVVELAEYVSDAALLDVVASVSSFGDPFTTLAALSAVADSSSSGSQEFSGILLDTLSGSGALSDPDPESVDATTAALASIVTSASTVHSTHAGGNATETSQEVVMEMEVATKAANLVSDIAVAAKGLEEGMQVATATLLINSVGTLLNTATATPATTGENSTYATDGNALSDEEVAQQKALSGQLRQATEAIGDAVIKATPLGETVTMNTTTGLQLNIMKTDNGALAAHGASVGGFTLPPMSGLAARRRLRSGRVLTSGETIGLQNAKWHKNPFSYAGSIAPAPTSSSGVASDLSISTEGVRSFSIRLDGEEVAVADLEDPIIIELPRHPNAERKSLSAQRRLSDVHEDATIEEVEECMYFDHTNEVWSTEGCSVVEISGDTLVCACNHLSFFSSALGSLSFLGDFLCPNVAILAPAGFVELGRGQWAQQRGGIVLWTLLVVHLVITLLACCSQGSWTSKPGFFLYADDAKGYSKMAVLKKMVSAGQKRGKSKPKMVLVFIMHVVLKLKLDYDYDELCQQTTLEMIRTLVFYKMMMMWVTATMGFSELDLRYMRHGNVVSTGGMGTRGLKVRSVWEETSDDDRSSSGDNPEEAPRVDAQTTCSSVDAAPSMKAAAMAIMAMPKMASGSRGPSTRSETSEQRVSKLSAVSSEVRRSLMKLPVRSTNTKLDNGITDEFVAMVKDKSRLLQRRRDGFAASGAPGARQAGERVSSSEMSTAQDATGEAVKFSEEVVVLYKAIHPLYKLLLYSMTVPWTFQIVALLSTVFGSLMLSAAFYGTSASPNIPECVGPDNLLGSIVRDMSVALASTIIGLAPIVVILSRRSRTMPRVSAERDVQRQLRQWFLKDVAIIVGGLLWSAFCILYIMLFLANVSQQDADHWLVSLLTRFISSWIILPGVLAILWVIVMRVFAVFSDGRFIENSVSALLRAIHHGGGGGELVNTSGARLSVDPPPLLHEGARSWATRLLRAGPDDHLPPVPPLGRMWAPAEKEAHFWTWVSHLRELNQQAVAPSTRASLSLASARAALPSPTGRRHIAHRRSSRSPGEPGEPERPMAGWQAGRHAWQADQTQLVPGTPAPEGPASQFRRHRAHRRFCQAAPRLRAAGPSAAPWRRGPPRTAARSARGGPGPASRLEGRPVRHRGGRRGGLRHACEPRAAAPRRARPSRRRPTAALRGNPRAPGRRCGRPRRCSACRRSGSCWRSRRWRRRARCCSSRRRPRGPRRAAAGGRGPQAGTGRRKSHSLPTSRCPGATCQAASRRQRRGGPRRRGGRRAEGLGPASCRRRCLRR